MDPTETLKQLLLAIVDDDRDDVLAYLDDLRGWIEKDGFLPDVEAVINDLTGDVDPDSLEPDEGDDEEGPDDELDEGGAA